MICVETGMETMAVTVRRTFNASVERVFDAWLDPERAREFLFTHPDKQQIVQAEIDPRVGGRYLFVARRNGKDSNHFGEYLEIDRPRRLVFTLCVPVAWSGEGRIEIDIAPADGGCELTLTHRRVPQHLAESVKEGWTTFIGLLQSQTPRVQEMVRAPTPCGAVGRSVPNPVLRCPSGSGS